MVLRHSQWPGVGVGGKGRKGSWPFMHFPGIVFDVRRFCTSLSTLKRGWKCHGGKEDPDTATETARQGMWSQALGEHEGGNVSLVTAGRGYRDPVS